MAFDFIEQVDLANQTVTQNFDALSYAYRDNVPTKEVPGMFGSQSLFNNYSVFRYYSAAGNYNNLYDSAGNVSITSTQSRNPSAQQIIQWANETTNPDQPASMTPYAVVDFLYCKYYNAIPNNYMLTLRRFPVPMLDNLKTPVGKPVPPIAQAVTWMGEETGNKLSEFFKFGFGQKWNEIEAYVQSVEGNEKDFSDVFAGKIGSVGSAIQGYLNPNEYSGLSAAQTNYAKRLYEPGGPYANKVYGPVNVIDKTMVRGRGMNFENKIVLNFHYSLKSFNGINPKMAMLDIFANFLTLTYNNAKFWGGAIRYFPQHPQHPFFGDQNAFYNGDIGSYIDSVVGKLGELGSGFLDQFSKFLQDPVSALKELATSFTTFKAGKIAARSRPQIISMQSLLTGAPVGEWHLVVGNPMNPIAMVGNLVCTNVVFSFNDKLGADDFPTELTFSVTLEHGRPRDKSDLESMFNLGNGRLYYGVDDAVFSSTKNTDADTSKFNDNTAGGASKSQGRNGVQIFDSTVNNTVRTAKMWGNKFDQTALNVSRIWTNDYVPNPKNNTGT